MAIIIQDKTKCPLCDKLISNNQDYILTPPLISNTKDLLFKFSDNGVHIDCIQQSRIKDKLLKHISILDSMMPPSNLKCIVDDLPISKPEKLIVIGLLTSNECDELYKFNYIVLNKDNVSKWTKREEFIVIGENYLKENKWIPLTSFNYLQYIINQIKSCRNR